MVRSLRYAELTSIANKVTSPLGRLSDIVYPQNKFDLEEVYNQCPDAREIIGSNGTERRLTTPIFKQLTLFCVNQTEQNSYKILGLIDNKRCYRWIDKRYIETHPNLEKYKVIVPKKQRVGSNRRSTEYTPYRRTSHRSYSIIFDNRGIRHSGRGRILS